MFNLLRPLAILWLLLLMFMLAGCRSYSALYRPAYLCKEIGGIPQYRIQHIVDDDISFISVEDTLIPVLSFDEYDRKIYEKCQDENYNALLLPNASEYIKAKRECRIRQGKFVYIGV
jgi:hypothetical protein